MNAPIILLNGWPGVGKDTVAETLKLLLGDDKANLMDWSRSKSETFQAIPGDDGVALKKQRDACFAGQVEHPSLRHKIIICTDCLSDTSEGRRLAQDFEVVANRCKRPLIPVYLDCHLDENMRRIANAERRVSLKDKSTPFPPSACFLGPHSLSRPLVRWRLADTAAHIVRSPNEAKTVRSEGGKLFIYTKHAGLSINTTSILPHEAALQILSFMKESMVRRDEALTNEETTPMEDKEPLWS